MEAFVVFPNHVCEVIWESSHQRIRDGGKDNDDFMVKSDERNNDPQDQNRCIYEDQKYMFLQDSDDTQSDNCQCEQDWETCWHNYDPNVVVITDRSFFGLIFQDLIVDWGVEDGFDDSHHQTYKKYALHYNKSVRSVGFSWPQPFWQLEHHL